MIWVGLGSVLVMVGSLFGYSLYRYESAKHIAELQKNIFQVNITPTYFNDVLDLAETWLAFRYVKSNIPYANFISNTLKNTRIYPMTFDLLFLLCFQCHSWCGIFYHFADTACSPPKNSNRD